MHPTSPFKHLTLHLNLHLPPCYWNQPNAGILYKLNKNLMKHIDELGGVLMAFWNIRVLEDKGFILDDTPHIHFPISFEALIFCPMIGTKLVGKVNKIGVDHIGLLVLDVFNASISAASLSEEYTKVEEDCWQHKTTQENLQEGESIEFLLSGFSRSKDIISIYGVLT